MKTNIEWADYSWNPYLWRCTKISPGCQHCYMMTLAERRGQDPTGPFGTRWPAAMAELRKMPSGAVIFVNSMSDTYHKDAKLAWIHHIHNTALAHPDKTFLALTKRPERALHLAPHLAWPGNLWLGVSVESGQYLWRIDYALATPAAGVFVSAEPLLGSIPYYRLASRLWSDNGTRRAVGWVIAGGESGGNRRRLERNWVRDIRDMCIMFQVPFIFKQGSAYKPGQDRFLDGRTWDEVPAEFLVRGALEPVAPPEPKRQPY